MSRSFAPLRTSAVGSRCAHAHKRKVLRSALDFGCGLALRSRPQQKGPSLRSGLRLWARASLTPTTERSFAPLWTSAVGSRFAHAHNRKVLRSALDFGCGLALRSRPQQKGPSLRSGLRLWARASLTPTTERSFAPLWTSAVGSRFAHAHNRKVLRSALDFGCGLALRSRPQQKGPSLRSGLRLWAR